MRTQETLDEKIERLLANLSAINTSMAALEVVKKDKTELESPEERKRRQEEERKKQNDEIVKRIRKPRQ
jgi:Skp family chaperone for outer membrane proteins